MKAIATHSSTLAWKTTWMEEPGRLQSMGLQRVGHDWATSLSLFTGMHWRRKWQPTPVFLPQESQGWGAWWAAVYGVTQSWTWLKRLSSSSTRMRNWKQPKWGGVWYQLWCYLCCRILCRFEKTAEQPYLNRVVHNRLLYSHFSV